LELSRAKVDGGSHTVADLHCHYPMHVLAGDQRPRLRHALRPHPEKGIRDHLRAMVMWVANRIANYRKWSSGPRVTLDSLEQGGVRLVLSVLYSPFSEIDLTRPYAAPPLSSYPVQLFEQMQQVEDDLADNDPRGDRVTVVRTAQDLDGALDHGRVALVHCVEGGFHLGATPEEVDQTVTELARRGVAYVTLAHLFWRRVATNAPAIPFLSDRLYDRLFPQRTAAGLGPLGDAAVRAMYRERVLIDLSHMRADALEQTFSLLDDLDRESGALATEYPVIASHAGVRLGSQSYNLTREIVQRIAKRNGVVGLIMAQHQLNDGLRRRPTRDFEQSLEVIYRHLDSLRDWTGSHGTGALGTDLDGFIKPTMGGVETAADLAKLGPALEQRYGVEDAARILSGNARRVVRQVLEARG
jgi:microsomal dipeptidase-like Zn-dependent dipeptidase